MNITTEPTLMKQGTRVTPCFELLQDAMVFINGEGQLEVRGYFGKADAIKFLGGIIDRGLFLNNLDCAQTT